MNTWQILLLNMLFLVGSRQSPMTPEPLTPQQLLQFEVAFKAGDFKVPAGSP